MPRIRRSRSGDGPSLRGVRLWALQTDPDAFGSSYEREVDLAAGAWEKWAVESSLDSKQCLVVADVDGVFVGMAGAYTPTSEPLVRELFGMWVAPEARSAGIGAGLVRAIIDWSVGAGAEEIRLWVVKHNRIAARLYARVGFEETGLSRSLPSNSTLLETQMSLRLDRAEPQG